MKSALKSFTAITISVFICLILAWLYLRGKGYNTPVLEPSRHPFITSPGQIGGFSFLVAFRGGSAERPENTFLAFDHAASLHPQLILWADIRPTKDGTLVVFHEQDLSATTNGQGWVGYTVYSEVSKLNASYKFQDSTGAFPYRAQHAKIPTLRELLERYPDRKFILNFRDYKPGLDQRIADVIDQAKAGNRVLIQSEENGLLKDLREKKPEWIFGTSQAQITLMRMLTSIGLPASAPLKGDVFVSEMSRQGIQLIDFTTVQELQRRKIPVFAGPISEPSEAKKAKDMGISGMITDSPSQFINQAP